MLINGAQTVCEVLKENKTDTVFAYPGGAVIDLFDELYKNQNEIKQIITAHEQGAAHAADGYARVSGKCGVVIATSGPGATNLVTGIAAAYMDSVAVVAITGNVAVSEIGKDSFQEVYTEGIFMPITKHTFVVRDINKLADTLRAAFKIAQSGRKGPVLVDIPKNIFLQKAQFHKLCAEESFSKGYSDTKKIAQALEMLKNAKRPILCYGGGVNSIKASESLKTFLQKTKMFYCHTLMGTGVTDEDSKQNLGLIGMHGKVSANLAAENADLILAAGTRFCDRVTISSKFAKKAKVIQIDIDPSEINKNVKVDLSINGDCGCVFDMLCAGGENLENPEWENQINQFKREDFLPKVKKDTLSACNVMNTINNIAGADAVYTTDVGQHQIWAAQYIKHLKPQSFLTSGGLGAMGYGYGAAIGAKCAAEHRCVVHITSDGSFLMNLNETSTAAAYKLNTITVILNNRSLGMVRQWQDMVCQKRHSGTEVEKNIDYLALADGFGAAAFSCKTLDEFESAMKAAVQIKDKPVWIECVTDKNENVLPVNSAEF